MPAGEQDPDSDGRFEIAEPTVGSFYRFLRYGHVLSSLLREFLEEDFLRKVCPHRLTRSQFCFLKLIATNSAIQVGELARSLGVSAAASSKNVDKPTADAWFEITRGSRPPNWRLSSRPWGPKKPRCCATSSRRCASLC